MEIQLDTWQRRAVESTAEALMIFAGPGAGKTRVITQRIIHLIEQLGTEPGRIVAVTFTNRAADEMRNRLLAHNADYEAVRVKTFHSLALDIIKRNTDKTHFTRRPVVFDEPVQDRILRDILRKHGLSTEVFPLRRLKSVIDLAKANLSFPLASDRFPPDFEVELRDVLVEYQLALLTHDALDFSDILLICIELLQDDVVREAEYASIDHLLIDEFQDINFAQYALVLFLHPPGKPISAVADENQTIYNWRGSSSRYIELFLSDYQPEIIRLEGNWRCPGQIITAAKAIIARNRKGWHEEITVEPEVDEEGPLITLFELNNEDEENRLVLRLAENARRSGVNLSEVAILGRTHYMMDGMYQELILNGVPVLRVHKEPDENSTAELLSYLEFARSLNEWDIESALHFPRRCLTSLDEIRLLEEARIEGEGGLWAVLQRATRDPRLSPLSRKRIADLIELVHEIPQATSEMGLSAAVYEAANRIAASRPTLKRETRVMLKGAIDEIEFDPSLNINELRDKLLESKTLKIVFSPGLMPFIGARIITETAEGLFGLKVELAPYSENLLIEPKKQPVIIMGLNKKQLHSLLPDTLLSNIPCVSDGTIHIPSSAKDDFIENHTIPLAAYALCSRLATPKLPDDPLEIVFVDLETTSVDIRRAEIVEIAAARYLLDAGHMRELNTFHRLVKPKRPIPQAASAVHGIVLEMVADAPPVEEVIEPLLDFIGDAVIAGHNASEYDIPIIQRFAGWILKRDIPNPILDSLAISRNLFPRVSHTLGALAEMMGVPLEDAHRALADVKATAVVMEKLLAEEAQSQGLEFSAPALNLLAAGYIFDETAPDGLTEALAEAAARYAAAHGARIDGLDALAEGLDEAYRSKIGELASFIRSRPIIEDEDDERFEFMRRRIEDEAIRFTEKNPDGSLGDFLDYYALLTDDDFVGEEEAIRLMSLHTAKGLEFDTVIIIGLEQGNLPHYLSIDHSDRVEEERRLFYVGLTRASRKVYLTYVRQREGIYRFPSMFLSELPKGLVKRLKTPRK